MSGPSEVPTMKAVAIMNWIMTQIRSQCSSNAAATRHSETPSSALSRKGAQILCVSQR